jgi:hypothetical protein
MNTKQHPKYPFQRVEQRHNTVDTKGLNERRVMEQISKPQTISIGTFTILPPKSDTQLTTFTLALNKALTKRELHIKLYEIFGTNLDEEKTKSIFVHLVKPIPLRELRIKLNNNFKETT